MRAAGAPERVIQARRRDWMAQQPEFAYVEVFPEHIPAFQVLQATADQWETPGQFGGRLALPLTEVQACMELLEVPDRRLNFMRVLGMARAARDVKIEQLKQAAGRTG